MTASFALRPVHSPVADARDRLLARLLLCVHPAVPRESQTPAALVWALGADPVIAAAAIRRSPAKVGWLLVRFERRVQALRLPERIPLGRNCSDRMVALIELVSHGAGRVHLTRRGPTSWQETELVLIYSALAEFLVSHPLAGTLGSHRLRTELTAARRHLQIEQSPEQWLAAGQSASSQVLAAVIASPRLP